MDAFFVLRRGKQFLALHMDFSSAREWQDAGWEIYPKESRETAQHILDMWRAGVWTPQSAVRATPSTADVPNS